MKKRKTIDIEYTFINKEIFYDTIKFVYNARGEILCDTVFVYRVDIGPIVLFRWITFSLARYLVRGVTRTILCREISCLFCDIISHEWYYNEISYFWSCINDILSRDISFVAFHERYYIAKYFVHCVKNVAKYSVTLYEGYCITEYLWRCIKHIVSRNISSVALYKGYCVAEYLICDERY